MSSFYFFAIFAAAFLATIIYLVDKE